MTEPEDVEEDLFADLYGASLCRNLSHKNLSNVLTGTMRMRLRPNQLQPLKLRLLRSLQLRSSRLSRLAFLRLMSPKPPISKRKTSAVYTNSFYRMELTNMAQAI